MNISNLLKYNIANTKYKYNITPATLSAETKFPTHTMQTTRGQLSISCQRPQIRTDSTDFFSSIGNKTIFQYTKEAAQKGKQAAIEATAEYAKDGAQLNNIDEGVTISQICRQKFMRQMDTTLVVKGTQPINISYTEASTKMAYTPASVAFNWNVDRAIRKYTPPDFGLNILQDPSVTFEYQGPPLLVPPSAAEHFSLLV